MISRYPGSGPSAKLVAGSAMTRTIGIAPFDVHLVDAAGMAHLAMALAADWNTASDQPPPRWMGERSAEADGGPTGECLPGAGAPEAGGDHGRLRRPMAIAGGASPVGAAREAASSPRSDPRPKERLDYVRYIASARWRKGAARLAELEASGRRCRLCDRGPPDVTLEVHHRNYSRLGAELAGDLTTLCHECHPHVTDMLRARRYALIAPPIPRDVDVSQRRILTTTEWLDEHS